MKFLIKILFLVAIPFAALAQITDPFQWSMDQSAKTARPGDTIPLEVGFKIPARYYLYREKMGFSLVEAPDGFKLGEIDFSPSVRKKDPFTGRDEEIFEGAAVLRARLRINDHAAAGRQSVKILLTYQGCSDTLCYRFTKRTIDIPVLVEGAVSETGIADPLFNHGFFVILLLTFLGGIGSAFTPCVLPVIPITLAFIGVRRAGSPLGKNFLLSLVLVLSMSLTYALLGLMAALLGKSLGFLFQSPYFLLFGMMLYVTFSLSLFGVFELQAPLGLRNRLAKLGGAGIVGAVLSGFTIGFLAAPCVGPLIASLLLYVAKTQNVVKGFSLLFVYGLGMGVLFLLIGTFYDRLASKIRGGRYTLWIERAFAVILLLPAFYYGSILYKDIRLRMGATHAASNLWIEKDGEAFATAEREGKPLFVDFFASWCFPCVQMERGTFSDEGFQAFLKERFVPLRIDCTEETAQCRRMVDKYSIVGWPTFLVLSPKGELQKSFIGQSLSVEELQKALEPLGHVTNNPHGGVVP